MSSVKLRHISVYSFKKNYLLGKTTPVDGDLYYLFGGSSDTISDVYINDLNVNTKTYPDEATISADSDSDSEESNNRLITIRPGQVWVHKSKKDGSSKVSGWFLFSSNLTKDDVEKMIQDVTGGEYALGVGNHVLNLIKSKK